MVGIRNGTIIVLVALFLFSSASCGESRFQKDAMGSDGNISIFEHSDNNLSSGVNLEGLNATSIQDHMKTRPPRIAWQECLGGSAYDAANDVEKTADRGYIVAGETYSNDGNVSGNHGLRDTWVVKLDKIGDVEWQKCLGGSRFERANSVQQTDDGGYIVAGDTNSTDGDVSGNHGNFDFWIVKLDGAGNIEWQKCLGGSSYDEANSIRQTADGGYIIAGNTNSSDGDVTGNHGIEDFWVVKIDSIGNIEWQKALGGSSFDGGYSVRPTADGCYIVAGITNSNDGDVSGNHGSEDFWVVKLDSIGNIEWQKCLGGSSYDLGLSVQQTHDRGYIVAGITNSNDGDVSGNHGTEDDWVVKLDSIGNIEWQKALGGSKDDEAISIQQTMDRGYIVAGLSLSNDGDVSGNHGDADSWLVKIDCLGNIQWQKSMGGTDYDDSWSARQTAGKGYIAAGLTFSNDGDVSGNHGNGDVWVVKLNSQPSTPHRLSGPESGYVGKAYTYSATATDPDGDKIKYTFDWGDGTKSVTGFVDSGERAYESHRWMEPGKYCVRVKATDDISASSEWSRAITVTETIAFAYGLG